MERIFTYPAIIQAQAERRGDAPYLVWKLDGEEPASLSYRAYADACAAVATWLKDSGIRPGHRVALALENSPEMVVAYGAVTSMGAIAVPINPTLSLPEMAFILQDVEASAFIGAPDRAEALAAHGDVASVERWLTPDVLWRRVASGGEGAPDALKGEIPVAFVRIDESADPAAVQAELEALCREELAPYKRPRRYHFVDAFPKTSTGKVLRRELRQMTAAR
ncbi:AMP-binding protein [Alicyclobacillus sendaiensis]|uniref:AMP-binding protein n=1 Tax=Alicyclobacillus sendaiensis PA2 TaxID=3029425 RepID=A0ABT6Y2B6_ALISE|nr:AMP-binding protein [Alicyclobacillus sendaiensis]MDI9261197.1 AMP-binding protein [Alicyclobacillus sendaiensis PA2]